MNSSLLTTDPRMAFGKNYNAPIDNIEYFNKLIDYAISECQNVTFRQNGVQKTVTDCLGSKDIEVYRLEAKENYISGIMRGKKRDISVLCAAIELINTVKMIAKENSLYDESVRQELGNIFTRLCRLVEDLQ